MVDILMATYNGENYLKDQLNSILSQTFKDWKIIVRDDGSTDDTVNILREYAQMYPGKIIIIEDTASSGSAKNNFLKLIKASGSEYAAFCDQDDVWFGDKLERSVKLMNNMEDKYGSEIPILVHSDLRVVDDKLRILNDSFTKLMKLPENKGINNLLIQNSVVGCTVLANKPLLDIAKQIDEDAPILMHDHALALIAASYGRIGYVREALADYRQHEKNSVGASEGIKKSSVIGRFIKGKKSFRSDMQDSFAQAAYIYNLCDGKFKDVDNHGRDEILRGYGELANADKPARLRFYRKYNIYKYSTLKKIVQILWT